MDSPLSTHSVQEIHRALEVLGLPLLSSAGDLKKRYRQLVQQCHHDIIDHDGKMQTVNHAYSVLKAYMECYKFSFSEEEILKQFPEEEHAKRFKF